MKFFKRLVLASVTVTLALSASRWLEAQSLADLARETRAKKQAAPSGGKTFTNDTIPVSTIGAAPSSTPGASGEEAQAPPEGQPPAAASGPAPAEPSMADIEKEYREKFAALREALSLEERKLDVMQRELNLAQQQYYSDPNVALREELTRSNINTRTAEIETQRAAVEKAKQAIASLEDELRQKSLPPGWAR